MIIFKFIPILFVLWNPVLSYPESQDSYVSIAFRKIKLVPDIIDHPPKDFIHVIYPKEKETVDLGAIISPTETDLQPLIAWPVGVDKNDTKKSYYTFVMTDPDAPSRKFPLLREMNHWLVMNILGDDVKTGDTIAEYLGASPGPGTGHHRYTFLAFKQPGWIDVKKMKRIGQGDLFKRLKFDTRKLIKKHKLIGPVAGNFFEAAFDKEGLPLLDKIMEIVD